MGKMPFRGKQWRGRWERGATQRGVELQQLLIRQGQQKALEKDEGFAQAGIQVVMRGVKRLPFALQFQGGRVVQLLRGVGKRFPEILDQIDER